MSYWPRKETCYCSWYSIHALECLWRWNHQVCIIMYSAWQNFLTKLWFFLLFTLRTLNLGLPRYKLKSMACIFKVLINELSWLANGLTWDLSRFQGLVWNLWPSGEKDENSVNMERKYCRRIWLVTNIHEVWDHMKIFWEKSDKSVYWTLPYNTVFHIHAYITAPDS